MSRILIRRNHLGHAEIVRGSEVGLIFDKALPIGAFTKALPSKFTSTVYQQHQKRIGGTKFWDHDTDFTENSAEEANKKAEDYIAKNKWQLVPYDK